MGHGCNLPCSQPDGPRQQLWPPLILHWRQKMPGCLQMPSYLSAALLLLHMQLMLVPYSTSEVSAQIDRAQTATFHCIALHAHAMSGVAPGSHCLACTSGMCKVSVRGGTAVQTFGGQAECPQVNSILPVMLGCCKQQVLPECLDAVIDKICSTAYAHHIAETKFADQLMHATLQKSKTGCLSALAEHW